MERAENLNVKLTEKEYDDYENYRNDVFLLEEMIEGRRGYVDAFFKTREVAYIAKKFFKLKKELN